MGKAEADCRGIMEKKMETTIIYWGSIGNKAKENDNYCITLGVYWDTGREKWKLLSCIGLILGIMEKKMKTTKWLYWEL